MITDRPRRGREVPAPAAALTAALLGFFVVTLDTSVVNVALPAISRDLRAGTSPVSRGASRLAHPCCEGELT